MKRSKPALSIATSAGPAPDATTSFSTSIQNPLSGKRAQAVTSCDARIVTCTVGLAFAVGSMDPEETQNAQIILGDPLRGLTDKAHPPCLDVRQPANVIMHHAVRGQGQAIDREIATLRIACPVTPECNLGLAPKRLDVFAQGRHFERLVLDHQGDRPVLDAGGHALDPRPLRAIDHFLRQRCRRDIDLAYRKTKERVTDGPADHARLFTIAIKYSKHASGRA